MIFLEYFKNSFEFISAINGERNLSKIKCVKNVYKDSTHIILKLLSWPVHIVENFPIIVFPNSFHIVFTQWSRKSQFTPVFLPGKFHGQRSLVGSSPWSCKESDKTEQLSTVFTEGSNCTGNNSNRPLEFLLYFLSSFQEGMFGIRIQTSQPLNLFSSQSYIQVGYLFYHSHDKEGTIYQCSAYQQAEIDIPQIF